eukprot:COSAG01_NODE_24467_length_777_cov_141.827434_2_plen_27_part_01
MVDFGVRGYRLSYVTHSVYSATIRTIG